MPWTKVNLLKEGEWSYKMKTISISLRIIGIINSPYKKSSDVPHPFRNEISEIEIYKDYLHGLKDIEGFSHLHVFYWMHKSKGYSLYVNTPWDNNSHGLFATRSPYRPNPIAHTIVKLVKKDHNILKVTGLDTIDGTPLIDIKPYIKKLDVKKEVVSGWLEKTELKGD
jgi:tRNA-Thr(GGU) m(6)t(6)A37 methyltransferase TsaA